MSLTITPPRVKPTVPLWTYSFLSAALLALAWPPLPLAPLLLVGFVPLFRLWASTRRFGTFWGYSLLTFFLWHLVVMRSGYYVDFDYRYLYVTLYVLSNALLMTVPASLFYLLLRTQKDWVWWTFPLIWTGYEYAHANWDYALTLVNLRLAFSVFPDWIRPVHWLGSLSLTLVVTLANVLIFQLWQHWHRPSRTYWLGGLAVLLGGWLLLNGLVPAAPVGKRVRVAAVQPGFDLYTGPVSPEQLRTRVNQLRELTLSVRAEQPDLVLWHETALMGSNIEVDRLQANALVQYLRQIAAEVGAPLLVGSPAFRVYEEGQAPAGTHRGAQGEAYDTYNVAMLVPPVPQKPIQLYYKNKLIVFFERVPFVEYFPWLERAHLALGMTYGSYRIKPNAGPLTYGPMRIAPIICSEAIYPEYVRREVRKGPGANLIAILTNDGWAGETAIVKQMAAYASLIALENGLPVARAANNGVSLFTDARGRVQQRADFNNRTVLVQEVVLAD